MENTFPHILFRQRNETDENEDYRPLDGSKVPTPYTYIITLNNFDYTPVTGDNWKFQFLDYKEKRGNEKSVSFKIETIKESKATIFNIKAKASGVIKITYVNDDNHIIATATFNYCSSKKCVKPQHESKKRQRVSTEQPSSPKRQKTNDYSQIFTPNTPCSQEINNTFIDFGLMQHLLLSRDATTGSMPNLTNSIQGATTKMGISYTPNITEILLHSADVNEINNNNNIIIQEYASLKQANYEKDLQIKQLQEQIANLIDENHRVSNELNEARVRSQQENNIDLDTLLESDIDQSSHSLISSSDSPLFEDDLQLSDESSSTPFYF